jgi:hypothetical protein
MRILKSEFKLSKLFSTIQTNINLYKMDRIILEIQMQEREILDNIFDQMRKYHLDHAYQPKIWCRYCYPMRDNEGEYDRSNYFWQWAPQHGARVRTQATHDLLKKLMKEDEGRGPRKTLRLINGLLTSVTFVPKMDKDQIIENSTILYKTFVSRGELRDYENKLNEEESIHNKELKQRIYQN